MNIPNWDFMLAFQVLQGAQALQGTVFPLKETQVQLAFLDYRAGREVKVYQDPPGLRATKALQAQKVDNAEKPVPSTIIHPL